jgi:hypothetical protein
MVSFIVEGAVVHRGHLVRNGLVALACAGGLGALTNPAKTEANLHPYIKLFHRDVLILMADEATECVAYFRIGAKLMGDAKMPNEANQADAASERSLDWALQLTKWAGLKEENVWTNLKFATEYMLMRIKTDNIDPVADYGQLCKNVVERPKDRALHWTGWLSRRENWK